MKSKSIKHTLYAWSTALLSIFICACNGNGTTSSSETPSNSALKNTNELSVSNSSAMPKIASYLYVLDGGRESYTTQGGGIIFPKPTFFPEDHGAIYTYSVESNGDLNFVASTQTDETLGYNSITVSPDNSNVYIPNYISGTISRYAINTSGALVFTENVPSISGSFNISITPDGKFLYVASESGTMIGMHSIEPSGHLNPVIAYNTHGAISTAGQAINSFPIFVSVDPSGTHLYVADCTYEPDYSVSGEANVQSIEVYTIQADGSLVYQNNVAGSPSMTGLTISPNGNNLFTWSSYGINGCNESNCDSNNLLSYQVDQLGSLSLLGAAPGGYSPLIARVSSNNKYVYELELNKNSIMAGTGGNGALNVYAIESNGSLTQTQSLAQKNIGAMTFILGPNEQFIYILDWVNGSLDRYTTTDSGISVAPPVKTMIKGNVHLTLRSLAIATVSTQSIVLINPQQEIYNSMSDDQSFTLAIDNNVDQNTINRSTVQLWSIESGGESALVAWAYDGQWSNDNSQVTFTPNSLLSYSHSYQLVIAGVKEKDGILLPTQSVNLFTTTQPIMMQYAYIVDNATASINMYEAKSDGSLVPLSPLSIQIPESGAKIEYMTISPDNKFMYVANNASNEIYQYAIQGSGQLKYITTFTTPLASPAKLVFTSSGNYAYVTSDACAMDTSGSTICTWLIQYSVNKATGALTLLSPNTVALLDSSSNQALNDSIVMYDTNIPGLSYLYTSTASLTTDSNGVSGYIDGFNIESSGQLKHISEVTPVHGYVSGMTVSQGHLYVVSSTLDYPSTFHGFVNEYDVVARSGQLTTMNQATVGNKPQSILFTNNGQIAYVSDSVYNNNQTWQQFNSLYTYGINGTNFGLDSQLFASITFSPPPSQTTEGIRMALNSSNNFIYVLTESATDPNGANVATNYYTTFSIAPSGELLQIKSAADGVINPTNIVTLAMCSNGNQYCY